MGSHLSASYHVPAFQPGNPGSSAVGEFSIQLQPPGSEGYAANKAIYDQLDYGLRVEMYESHDGASLGKLVFAGIITGIDKAFGTDSHFTLSGVSDPELANKSKPFPAEGLRTNYRSGSNVNADYRQARNFFGTNELGAADAFNPYTSANYSSSSIGGTAGTWSGATDDGLNVVSCSTGTGAALVSKMGAAGGDLYYRQYIEVSGRLLPSADATNAGKVGIGLSSSNASAIGPYAYVQAKANGTNWDLDVKFTSGLPATTTYSNALTTVQDPDGYIPITIGLLIESLIDSATTAQITVNGQTISVGLIPGSFTVTAGTNYYPFLYFGTPASGTATCYLSSMVQQVRFSDDANPGTAVFKSGSIGTPAHSLPLSTDPGPTFLEVWSRVATREGWYWRYTPQPYVIGTRTLGTIDLTADPGTDRGSDHSVMFSRDAGNLVGLQLSANSDQFASATSAASVSGTDGGGLAPARDVPSMAKWGVIEDQTFALPAASFVEQRSHARAIVSNKTTVGVIGSKAALVLRDPQTAGKWRELDKVLIHDPEMGISNQVSRILSYTFDEGSATQSVILDQFGAEHIAPRGVVFWIGHTGPSPIVKRFQQAVFAIGAKFKSR